MTFTFNANTVIALIALLAACLGYSRLYYDLKHAMDVRVKELEIKVETMWAFQMRRAFSEAVEKGVAVANSPLTFLPGVRERLDPIKEELIAWWKETGHVMSNALALLDIERLFGDRLLQVVCLPCNLTHGACLLLAMAVAKETREIDITL